jgi:hypothetical protein
LPIADFYGAPARNVSRGSEPWQPHDAAVQSICLNLASVRLAGCLIRPKQLGPRRYQRDEKTPRIEGARSQEGRREIDQILGSKTLERSKKSIAKNEVAELAARGGKARAAKMVSEKRPQIAKEPAYHRSLKAWRQAEVLIGEEETSQEAGLHVSSPVPSQLLPQQIPLL